MHSWKDKLKEKLPLFFFDSSPSSPCSSSPTSSSDHDEIGSTFSDETYLSSVFSFFFPSNGSGPTNQETEIEPIQSLATSNLKSLRCNHSDTSSPKTDSGGQGSGKSVSSPEAFQDAIDLQTPRKYVPELNLGSVFINSELYQFFQACLPNIVKGCRWVLVYSTVKHGISLRTLIRNTCDLSGPCLLITGDTKGVVFGGLLNCPLTPTPTRKYQGTVQTFVFTTLYGAPTLFRPTGENRYFYMCLNDLLAFGGGGSFALRLDGDFCGASFIPLGFILNLVEDLELELD